MQRSRAVERKLFYAAAGWLSGLVLCGILPTEYVVIAAAAGAFALAAAFRSSKVAARRCMIVCFGVIAGAAYLSLYSAAVEQPLTRRSGRLSAVRGIVTEIDDYDTARYITVKGRVVGVDRVTSVRFRVGDEEVACGDEVKVIAHLSVPQDTLTFDKQDYARSLGIFLEGSGTAKLTVSEKRADKLTLAMTSLRSAATKRIRELLPGQDGAFITAVLCSDRTALDSRTKSAVYRAGLGHLFAVSGTHVVILCALLGAFFDALFVPARTRSAVTILFLICLAVFAGGSISVVRACLMSGVSRVAGFFHRRSDSATSLGLAAILITLSCPYAVRSVAFELSFTASFAIGTLAPAICRHRVESGALRSLIGLLCISALNVPVCVMNFTEVSVVSVAVNLLLIPLCTLCLALTFVFIVTGMVMTPLLGLAGLAARAVIAVCRAVTASPLSFTGTYFHRHMLILAVCCAAVFILASLAGRKRKVILPCIAAYIITMSGFLICDRLPKSDAVTVIPRSYGGTAIVFAEDSAYICDTGGLRYNAYTAAAEVERRHPKRVYLCTADDAPADVSALADELADLDGHVFPDSAGSLPNVRFEGKTVIVNADGEEVSLSGSLLTVDGKTYDLSRFDGVHSCKI